MSVNVVSVIVMICRQPISRSVHLRTWDTEPFRKLLLHLYTTPVKLALELSFSISISYRPNYRPAIRPVPCSFQTMAGQCLPLLPLPPRWLRTKATAAVIEHGMRGSAARLHHERCTHGANEYQAHKI